MVPFAFTGVSVAHPRLFEASPDGAFSLNLVWSQAIAAGRAYGVRMDGVWMHVGIAGRAGGSGAVPERCSSRLNERPRGGAVQPVRRIYTVPPGRPFLTALARRCWPAICRRRRAAPATRCSLPTSPCCCRPGGRRAPCRRPSWRPAGGGALLLPRIRPIIGAARGPEPVPGALDDLPAARDEVKPAIGEIARQLALAKLVLRWSEARARRQRAGGRHRAPTCRRPRARRRRPPGWRASSPG